MSDCVDGFDDKVFSISAVSGGSLGAAIYELGAQLLNGHARACELGATDNRNGAQTSDHPVSVRAFGSGVLSTDFLAPTAERLLFGDLFRAAFPFHVAWPARISDRGDALRESWHDALLTSCQRMAIDCTRVETFNQPLLQWRGGARWIPVSIFNATHLETGARFLSSTSAVRTDALDFHEVTAADTSLGEAVLNSARFPVVSPAGRLAGSGTSRGHVVDGSYFDNSGAKTTLEIAREVLEIAKDLKVKLAPVFLNLENDPGFWESIRLSKGVAERYFRGNQEITQADAFQVMLKERLTLPSALSAADPPQQKAFHLSLSQGGVLHELMVAGMGVINAWSSHRAAVHRDFDSFYRAGAREIDVRLCPGEDYSPTLGWKLGRQNKILIDAAVLHKPEFKPTPQDVMLLFSYEASKISDEELRYLRTQGGDGRRQARELEDRHATISRMTDRLPRAYWDMFGKYGPGEGLGKIDMLGRALAFNLCHNAIHDAIDRVRDASSSTR